MTNQELAEWFGIKEKSLRSTRKKKLEILKEYAKFEDLRGKVNILEIINPVYTKGSKDYKLIKAKTQEQWNKTGLDTCRCVAHKIKSKYKEKLTITDDTLYNYTCTSKRELWGKAYASGGEIGYCIYELCKKINNKCEPFTEAEQEIKKELLNKYFGNTDKSEITIYIMEMLKNKEITEKEFAKMFIELTDLDNDYSSFKAELELLIGSEVITATRVITNAF